MRELSSWKHDIWKNKVIWERLSVEDIERIGWVALVEMSFAELYLPADKFAAFWFDSSWRSWTKMKDLKANKVIVIDNNLTAEQIEAIGWEFLALEEMWLYKIRYIWTEPATWRSLSIWKNLSVKEIKEIWWARLAEISFAELYLPADKFAAYGCNDAWVNYSTLYRIRPEPTIAVNNYLTVEQIKEIWWEELSKMSPKQIEAYGQEPPSDKKKTIQVKKPEQSKHRGKMIQAVIKKAQD